MYKQFELYFYFRREMKHAAHIKDVLYDNTFRHSDLLNNFKRRAVLRISEGYALVGVRV